MRPAHVHAVGRTRPGDERGVTVTRASRGQNTIVVERVDAVVGFGLRALHEYVVGPVVERTDREVAGQTDDTTLEAHVLLLAQRSEQDRQDELAEGVARVGEVNGREDLAEARLL